MSKIWHIVLFRTAPDVTAARVNEIRGLFQDCVGRCDGLEWMKAGTNNSKSQFADGWNEAIVMQFRDGESRDGYVAHPLHQKASQEVQRGYYSDLVVFDIDAADEG